MSSEIQFGDLEQNEPQEMVRPDRDAHFLVGPVGDLEPGQLPIFVDLDVLRDMEAHAQTNTRVELGGVMLGKQCIDAEGQPFVLITDSLRAEHYEATRGSFKFTHDTWQQISRQRALFHPDLEMVGWYHTHPGWTVFLSPMDLFICNNFFNRPLDVALVIDPCNDDRGWFQWNEEGQTEQTGGFFVTSNRYRESELQYFCSLYNGKPMNDPRYSSHASIPSTTVIPMDNRKPWFELATLGMLLMQGLLMAVIFFKAFGPDAGSTSDSQPTAVSLKTENRSLRLALDALARTDEQKTLADKYVDIETERNRVSASLDGQIALTDALKGEKQTLIDQSLKQQSKIASMGDELDKLKSKYTRAADAIDATEGEQVAGYSPIWLIGSSLLGLLAGASGMMLLQNRNPEPEEFITEN